MVENGLFNQHNYSFASIEPCGGRYRSCIGFKESIPRRPGVEKTDIHYQHRIDQKIPVENRE